MFIYVFCVDLRTNSDYFPIQHKLTGFYNRDVVCLLRGTDWVFKRDGYSSVLTGWTSNLHKNTKNISELWRLLIYLRSSREPQTSSAINHINIYILSCHIHTADVVNTPVYVEKHFTKLHNSTISEQEIYI